MAIGDDVLRRAQDFDRRAMEELLADVYPAVYRMAHALTGKPGAGRQVVHDVIRRSLRVLPKWRTGVVPENWFYHHTLLSSREFRANPPDPRQDLLVTAAKGPAAAPVNTASGEIGFAEVSPDDASYVAFVRALRNLPPQQAEAFILHHAEKFNERLLGVAMDCSTAAAANHLRGATEALSAVSGESFARFGQALAAVSGAGINVLTATLERAYHALTPPPTAVAPVARRYVSRSLRPRRLRRLFRLALLLILIAGGYFAWRERARWLPWAEDLKDRYLPATAPATHPM